MRALLVLSVVLFGYAYCARTYLDSLVPQFRIIKTMTGRTFAERTRSLQYQRNLKNNRKLQDYIEGPFPCSMTTPRSPKVPTSVHELRPGDIDIIGGIGDSLTAGYGIHALSVIDVLFLEDRGHSFSAGGENDWRTALTIPNIIKEFNPKLFGYALGPSITIQRTSQFNVAEGGAFSEDTPYMAKVLVKRIVKDPRTDLKNHWKMVNYLIGGNDFCSDICFRPRDVILREHKKDVLSVLRTLRDNLPRTIVNLIPPPHMRILAGFKGKPDVCKLTHSFECACIVGSAFANRQKELSDLMDDWIKLDKELADLPEFDLDDFTVVYQPFVVNYTFPELPNGLTDFSFMSADCFHFSRKGNARVANSLWNNILEPVGAKSVDGVDIMTKFMCPTEDNPYIFTRRNSKI